MKSKAVSSFTRRLYKHETLSCKFYSYNQYSYYKIINICKQIYIYIYIYFPPRIEYVTFLVSFLFAETFDVLCLAMDRLTLLHVSFFAPFHFKSFLLNLFLLNLDGRFIWWIHCFVVWFYGQFLTRRMFCWTVINTVLNTSSVWTTNNSEYIFLFCIISV